MAEYHAGPRIRWSSPMAMMFFLISAMLHLGHASALPHLHSRQATFERPAQAPYAFNDTVEYVKQVVAATVAAEQDLIQDILKCVDITNATFENTILPYLQVDSVRNAQLQPFYVYDDASDIGGIASDIDANATSETTKTFTNADYFLLVDHIYQANLDDKSALSEENQLMLVSFWNAFASSGLNIPAGTQRDQFQTKQLRLDAIDSEFNRNLNSSLYVYFTAEEIEGVDPDVIQSFPNATGENAGKLKIDMFSTAGIQVLNKCVNDTTRYGVYLAYAQTGSDNVQLVKESTKLRFELAQLNNLSSWDEYAIEGTMAGTTKAVDDFLTDLQTNIYPLGQSNLAILNALKQKDERLESPIGDRSIAYRWDQSYYNELQLNTTYDIDYTATKDYFPVNVTVPAVLDIYGEIYGLRFDHIDTASPEADELSPTGKGSDLVWHPDVMMYAVWDNQAYRDANPAVNGTFRGYLYFDLFIREGKTSETGFENLFIPGFSDNGELYAPSIRVVLNFQKSPDESIKPSLIGYYDIKSVMHELGHGTHDLTSITTYAWNHGTNGVPADFLEFPAMFMENFALIPEALKSISTHWSSFSPQAAEAWRKEQGEAPDAPLPPVTMPDDLIAKVVKSSALNQGIDALDQIAFSRVDRKLYGSTSLEEVQSTDDAAVYNEIFRRVSGFPDNSDLGQGNAWGNLIGQISQFVSAYYAGLYYSYQWCTAYAADVFYTAFYDDPFNSATGWRYRQTVLQPSGTKDIKKLLPAFLEREPNTDGYYRQLGIKGKGS
ncbi:unnamed protein product [Zymoseptoria tritici ST99CH_1A5]|uniref:Peptidase M3A/M3B catalytic domain-containing protein n=1 Tax=Zymoseptoria tritici ST99CH_1A5 TaxID=1276529 RepID=A0A1Y6LBW5_ZYMTR|nr:unnamed protein product [Zymoseptoria tritici ST99CH_1A5]